MPSVAAKRIAEELLGSIDWVDGLRGFCTCPGEDLHTTATGARDCRVALDGAPTVYCFHSSCAARIADANHLLRFRIGRTESSGGPPQASPERQQQAELRQRADAAFPRVLGEFSRSLEEFSAASPTPMNPDPRQDWRRLLDLFDPEDVLWIGDKFDSGREHHRANFQRARDWLQFSTAPAPFVVPSQFRPGVHERTSANVLSRRFLVVESDTLTKVEAIAVIRWLHEKLPLRAVVDTAGKSLHAWFDYPDGPMLSALRVVLPVFQCDPALFRAAQPVRLPGALRSDRGNAVQRLVWFCGRKAV